MIHDEMRLYERTYLVQGDSKILKPLIINSLGLQEIAKYRRSEFRYRRHKTIYLEVCDKTEPEREVLMRIKHQERIGAKTWTSMSCLSGSNPECLSKSAFISSSGSFVRSKFIYETCIRHQVHVRLEVAQRG